MKRIATIILALTTIVVMGTGNFQPKSDDNQPERAGLPYPIPPNPPDPQHA